MDLNKRALRISTRLLKRRGGAGSRCHGLWFWAVGVLLAAAFWMGTAHTARAQFGPLLDPAYAPQAKSEEELDLYLKIMTDSNPQATVADVEHFAVAFPRSELLGLSFQYQMAAYWRLHDLNHLLIAGKKALKLQPNNVNTLLTLASAISEETGSGPDADTLLQQGGEYANQALKELDGMRIPREISLQRWKAIHAALEAQARQALTEIAVKKREEKK